ncbi:MAG: hypothetical protein D6731_23840 [Planctomycetota bacterium]|nr:MAG: hypothetical protein D6731_23840 [Planctomycetota bacterium]
MASPRPCLAALLAGGLVLALSHQARGSNGPQPQTVGTKGPVSLPIDGDGQNMLRMPSSMAWSLEHRVDLDLFLFYSESSFRNALNDFDGSGSTFGISFGLIWAPGRPDFESAEADEYSDAGKLTFAVGFMPDMAGGGGKKSFVRLETFPDGIGQRKAIQFLNVTLAASYTITDWLAVGVGGHLIRASLDITTLVGGGSTPLNGSPQINDVNFPGNPTYADLLNLFSSDAATDPTTLFESELASFQFGATFSVSFRPLDNLGFGISYRPRSWDPLHFEGDARIDATATLNQLGPTTLPLLLATLPGGGNEFARGDFDAEYEVELYGVRVPRQVRASVAWWPSDRFLLAFEATWIEWQRAFRRQIVKMTKGDNSDLNFIVGSSSITSNLPGRWKNTWVFALYGSARITDWLTLRSGVTVANRHPFNMGQTGVAPNSGLSTVNLSFGAGWNHQFSNGSVLEINALVEHSFHESDHVEAVTDVKTASGSYLSSKQWFFHIGASLTF